MTTLAEFVAEHHITADVIDGVTPGERASWGYAQEWTVTMHLDGRRMVTPFFGGAAVETPDAHAVLEAMLSDAAGVENEPTVTAWKREYGGTTREWQLVVSQTRKLRTFLADLYETAVWGLDN